RAPPTRGDGLHGYGDCRRMIRETIRHAPRASAMHRPPHCPRTAPTYRLQTVSKTGAHLRVLARISEEVERGLNLPIRGAKRRIGVRRRLLTFVQRFRVRFPCATAITLLIYLPFSSDAVLLYLSPLLSPDVELEQPDRALLRGGAEVHVPLRGGQADVPGELLDRLRRRPPDGQARAEGVPQDVKPAGDRQPCPALRTPDPARQGVTVRSALVVAVEHARALQMAMRLQRGREPRRHVERPSTASLRRSDVPFPLRLVHVE